MTTNTNPVDLTAADDFDLNDLPERMSFAPWPKGVFDVTVEEITNDTREYGDGNIVPVILFKVTLDDIIEVSAKTETADMPAIGAINEWAFSKVGKDDLGTKRSQGEIRMLGTPFAVACGSAKASDWMPAAKGMKVRLVTSLSKGKKKEDGSEPRVYSNIANIAVLDLMY